MPDQKEDAKVVERTKSPTTDLATLFANLVGCATVTAFTMLTVAVILASTPMVKGYFRQAVTMPSDDDQKAQPPPDLCAGVVCQNGASCVVVPGGYPFCFPPDRSDAPPGPHPCGGDTCPPNAFCEHDADGRQLCVCRDGFQGPDCDLPEAPPPKPEEPGLYACGEIVCPANSMCVHQATGTSVCVCRGGFQGPSCDTPEAPPKPLISYVIYVWDWDCTELSGDWYADNPMYGIAYRCRRVHYTFDNHTANERAYHREGYDLSVVIRDEPNYSVKCEMPTMVVGSNDYMLCGRLITDHPSMFGELGEKSEAACSKELERVLNELCAQYYKMRKASERGCDGRGAVDGYGGELGHAEQFRHPV